MQFLKPSPTFAIMGKAQELKKKGFPVLNFSVGEPDFDTPEHVKEAAVRAMKEGFTRYTATAGILELREAIAEKLKKENGIDAEPEEVIVSPGGKHALNNIFQTLCEKGDEVIIPSPYWPSFMEQVRLCEATPVVVEGTEFKVSADELREKISPKTKALILNSPNNPSGAVYSKNELKKIAELSLENGFWIIADEMYEKFVFEGEHYSMASLGEEIKEKTITINGLSKTYAMTGWRIGYCHAKKELAQAISHLQGNASGNANSIAQKAAIAALTGPQQSVQSMVREFDKRRVLLAKGLNQLKGFSCPIPDGAFYAFPSVQNCFNDKTRNSLEFCEFLLNELHLATVPGHEFGKEGFARFSCATSTENIQEALERLQKKFG